MPGRTLQSLNIFTTSTRMLISSTGVTNWRWTFLCSRDYADYHHESLCRFSEKAGADIPRWLDKAMAQRQDSDSDLQQFVEMVSRMCERLIELSRPALLHAKSLGRDHQNLFKPWRNSGIRAMALRFYVAGDQ